MGTSNVIDTKSGTGWTIDVTACDLNTNLSEKDFVFLVDGTLANNADMTKTSATILTYGGADIGTNISVEVRRKTPATVLNTYAFISRFSSTDYNNEWDRTIRRWEEANLNGVGPGSTVTSVVPLDDAFGVGWDGDTVRPATRNALYDEIVLKAYIASPAFTGDPTAPTPSTGDNDTSVATTAFVHNQIDSDLANSPALGGTPTAPNAAVSADSTQIATTAWVRTRNRQQYCGSTLSPVTGVDAHNYITYYSATPRSTIYLVNNPRAEGGSRYTALWDATNSRWVDVEHGDGTYSIATSTFTSASLPADIFFDYNGGSPNIGIATWASDTARSVSLVSQDGVLVLSGAPEARYMGTVRLDASKTYTCNTLTTGESDTTLWQLYRHYGKEELRIFHSLSIGLGRDLPASGVKGAGLIGTTGLELELMLAQPISVMITAQLSVRPIIDATKSMYYVVSSRFGSESDTAGSVGFIYSYQTWDSINVSNIIYNSQNLYMQRTLRVTPAGYYSVRLVDILQWDAAVAQVGALTILGDVGTEHTVTYLG